MLRSVVQQELEGERDFVLNQEEIEQLARSIEASRSKQFPDEVGAGSVVPEGSRVCLGQDVAASRVTARRRQVASAVRGLREDAPTWYLQGAIHGRLQPLPVRVRKVA